MSKSTHQSHNAKHKRSLEAPVVELDSMLAPEKTRQAPKYTQHIEKVIFQRKNV